MYWGAISTDIKKSSVNWNNLPKWMEKAVQYHNIVIMTVFDDLKTSKGEKFEKILKLPNSPEGDAFTFLFAHKNENDLRYHVTQMAFDIQILLHYFRNQDKELKLKCRHINELELESEKKKLLNSKDYYGGIYIRIGMAFSTEAPLSYEYKRFVDPDFTEFKTRRQKEKEKETLSYRGSVIYMSEEAEKRANFKMVEAPNGIRPSIKECFYQLDDEDNPTDKLAYRNVTVNEAKKPTTGKCEIRTDRRGSVIKPDQNTTELIYGVDMSGYADSCRKIAEKFEKFKKDLPKSTLYKGIAVFIKYASVLNTSGNTYNVQKLKYIRDEYNNLHEEANLVFVNPDKDNKGFIGKREKFRGGLIKQKRDDSSMYIITPTKDNDVEVLDLVNLYLDLTRLLAFLPHGSSIGIAHGEMNEVSFKYDDKTYFDYFGEGVNLAARMEFKDFTYKTKWGIVDSRSHKNRIAITSSAKKMMKDMEELLEKEGLSFQIDHIPLKVLNVGSGNKAIVLSTKIAGIPKINAGDMVEFIHLPGQKYKVLENQGDKLKIKKKEKEEILPIHKLKL